MLHFESSLDYQMQATEAVCDLFRGQKICRTEFTVTMKAPTTIAGDMFLGAAPQQMMHDLAASDMGVGNRLTLLDDELHKHLTDIHLHDRLRNGYAKRSPTSVRKNEPKAKATTSSRRAFASTANVPG